MHQSSHAMQNYNRVIAFNINSSILANNTDCWPTTYDYWPQTTNHWSLLYFPQIQLYVPQLPLYLPKIILDLPHITLFNDINIDINIDIDNIITDAFTVNSVPAFFIGKKTNSTLSQNKMSCFYHGPDGHSVTRSVSQSGGSNWTNKNRHVLARPKAGHHCRQYKACSARLVD